MHLACGVSTIRTVNRMCACGAVAPARGPCPRCHVRAPDKRPSSGARGYGYAWHKGLRRRQLQRQPLCEYVSPSGERCTARATDVDHIIPKAKGGADALHNLQSLCHRHHSMKTVAENPQPAPSMRYRRAMSSRLDVSQLMGEGPEDTR